MVFIRDIVQTVYLTLFIQEINRREILQRACIQRTGYGGEFKGQHDDTDPIILSP